MLFDHFGRASATTLARRQFRNSAIDVYDGPLELGVKRITSHSFRKPFLIDVRREAHITRPQALFRGSHSDWQVDHLVAVRTDDAYLSNLCCEVLHICYK